VSRRLIVNADDFGRSPGINRGIVEAHRHGIVTSTTLMVNLPWSPGAAELAADVPELGVGLHLNFCYGPPLSTGSASLLGPDDLLDRDLSRLRERATASDIDREARVQLVRFRELLGRDPTHLDSHQHVHSWPAAIQPVAALARELGVPVRACSVDHRDLLRMLEVACPDAFVIDFYGAANINVSTLSAIVAALPCGTTELMCHPGRDDDAIVDSSYRREREIELATLCAPEVQERLIASGIELASFRSM
jgi:predicted glycoside hydrolase/deacetylase ChbG (UPF0249 family)